MDQTLMAEAILGKDAEDFFTSDIGRYVLARAEAEINEAIKLLKKTPPDLTNVIRDLQNVILRAESFKEWLTELIIAGHQAMTQIEEHQAND